MQLKLNLATRTYIDTGRLNLAVAAAVVIFGAALFFQVRETATNAAEIKRFTREMAALSGGEKGEVPAKDYQALLARIHFANEVIARKTFNWLALFDRLEGVVPDGIALSSIEPDLKGKSLKLSGAARSFQNLRQLMENLEGSNYFTDVYLQSQTESQLGPNQKVTGFTISCKVDYQ
jgi:type IV pilus assembly protein PilN